MGFNADASRIALPRGRVFLARKSVAGVLGPYLHLGNCSALEFATIGDDIAEITDFTSNTATPLTRVSKSRKPEFPLKLYECNPDNLALVFMGTAPTEFTQAATPITGEIMPGGAKVGGIYKTAKYGPISSITVTVGATTATVNTHYVLRDANVGIIELIALPGSEVEGAAVAINYTPTARTTGNGFKQIAGGAAPRIEGRLLYVGTSNQGPRHQLDIWNCAVTSDGSFPFVGTDPNEFGLRIGVLADPSKTELFMVTELSNGSGAPLA